MGLTKLVGGRATAQPEKHQPRNSTQHAYVITVSPVRQSSLAFDTIYAEASAATLNPFRLRSPVSRSDGTPDVDVIEGLSPSIAIEQKTTSRSPRSTVGTITEITIIARCLRFRRVPHCPNCAKPSRASSSEAIVQSILQGELAQPDDRVMILAPIVRAAKRLSQRARKAWPGWLRRVRINGELYPMTISPLSTSARITP